MSKQSSLDWLKKQYYESEGKLTRHDFEQAKAMHKDEIEVAYSESFRLRNKPYSTAVKYYNETFGGENERHK